MSVLDEYSKWLNHESVDITRIRNMGLQPWDVYQTEIQLSILRNLNILTKPAILVQDEGSEEMVKREYEQPKKEDLNEKARTRSKK